MRNPLIYRENAGRWFWNFRLAARRLAPADQRAGRLEGKGTSYREVLADVRFILAIQFLRRTRLTVAKSVTVIRP